MEQHSDIHEYIHKMKNIHNTLLNFIDEEDNIEENFKNLTTTLFNFNIQNDKYQLRAFLQLISIIANNHYRSNAFFNKIEKIIVVLRKKIIQFFTESEIFELFYKSKRIILLFIEENLLTFNKYMVTKMIKENKMNEYYFYSEFKDFIDNQKNDNEQIDLSLDDYRTKRNIGENDKHICQLIRDDQIDEFVSYIKDENIQINSKIEPSAYETNSFLINKKPSLIEYAAFFGSVQIFKYLHMKNADTTSSIWLYAVHSNNMDLFHFLEDNHFDMKNMTYMKLFKQSIKCHHIDIANYFLSNFLDREEYLHSSIIEQNFVDYSIHYYNYEFFPEELDNTLIIQSLIKYNHFDIFKILYANRMINDRKAYKFAQKEGKQEIINYLSINSSEINEKKPFQVWEESPNGQIKLSNTARDRFSSAYYPCFVILFGILETGKTTLATHLVSGPKSNLSNPLIKKSYSSKSCTHSINAIGPIKCREIASSFNILTDDVDNKNYDRDIFIIDSEGFCSIDGEIEWLKQALCSMIPIANVSFFVTNSLNRTYINQYMEYSNLIQILGKINIHHGFGYIKNLEKIDDPNVIQSLLKQNEDTTRSLIEDLSSKFTDVDYSHFKCLSVLSFDRHPNYFDDSLNEVARFIVDTCLYEGTKINGSLIVNIIEKIANKTKDIYNNLNNKQMNDKILNIFTQCINDEMRQLISDQEIQIQNDIAKKISMIPFHNLNLIDINDSIAEIEKGNYVDDIINKAILEIFSDTSDYYPLDIKPFQTLAIEIIKNSMTHELQAMKEDEDYKSRRFDDFENRLKNVEEVQKKMSNIMQGFQSKFEKTDEIIEELDNLKNIVVEMKTIIGDKKENIEYSNQQPDQFNGILTRLGQGNAKNSLKNGIIDITSSSIIDSDDGYQPKNVLNYDNDKLVFESNDEPDSWLCIDFKKYKVNPTYYSIKSNGFGGKGANHPKNWDIEGSNDSVNWVILDSRRNEESLDDCAASNIFEITNEMKENESYRYLRIIQKGPNSNNDNFLIFSSIEFFGSLEY